MFVPDAAMDAMPGCASGCRYVVAGVGTEGQCGAKGAHWGCGVGLPAAGCLRVCLSASATATSRFKINRRGVAVAEGDHAGMAFTATMLRTSLVKPLTCVLSRALSSLIWSMILFIGFAVILDRSVIFQFILSSNVWVNMFYRAENCNSIAGLIPLFSRSFRVMNRVACSRLERGLCVVDVDSLVGTADALGY